MSGSEKMNNDKINFVQSAILDTQMTVRAIDVKIGALLIVVLSPFSNISKIFSDIDKLCCCKPQFIYIVLSVSFLMFWLLVLFSLIHAISATDNPSRHIINSHTFKGTYYGGGLYEFCMLDALYNRKVIKANRDV